MIIMVVHDFNSRPCVGSDILNRTEDLIHINFNSCSLRGERWMNLYFHVYTNLISIHAPRMESDIIKDENFLR